jgi:ABC-type phosphate transport system substrate-binding protein
VAARRILSAMAMAIVFALALALPRDGSSAPAGIPIVVIAARDTPAHALGRADVAAIFLRQQVLWGNGVRVQPVNLPPAHPLRRAFSDEVLGRTAQELESYWREMYFHGALPPHVLASEEAVLLFVQSTPGAIGYVGSCPGDKRVNVLFTINEPAGCR